MWFHFLYLSCPFRVFFFKSFPQNPFTPISAKALMFPQQEFNYLFFLRFLRGKYCFFFVCINFHCISLTLLWNGLSVTHISHTRFQQRVCASSRNVFSTTQNNTVPLKNVSFPKWYLPASRKYQKVLFCVRVCYLLALRLKSFRKRSTRMWTSCQCLRSSIRWDTQLSPCWENPDILMLYSVFILKRKKKNS